MQSQAAEKLKDCCGDGENLDEIAGQLGYTVRHLRRVFMEAYHVPPVQYLQTCRLLKGIAAIGGSAAALAQLCDR